MKLTTAQLEQNRSPESCEQCHKPIGIDEEFYIVEHAKAKEETPIGFKTRQREYYILCSSFCLHAWATKNHAKGI